jgi:hypothetical protein
MAPVREPGQGPVPRPAMIARYPAPRRLPSRPRERRESSTAAQTARPRPRPMPSSLTAAPRFRQVRPTKPRDGCRRSRRHPRPGPARGLRGFKAIRQLRGFLDRREPRPPRRTSGAQGPARLVPRHLRHLRPRGLAAQRGLEGQRGLAGQRGLRAPGASDPAAQARREAGLTSRVRELRAGRPRRGLRDLVRQGRVRRGPADLAAPGLVLVARVLARGQATTRSARPRPAWDRRLRPGRRRPVPPARLALLVRQLIRPVLGSPRGPQAVPALPVGSLVLVRADADRAGRPVRPMAVRVLAVRVRAAPGRAR